jgi:multidrug efflux pump
VVAGSVIISSFVSLTLTPMLSARFLKRKEKPSKFYRVTERFFERMTGGYNRSLTWFVGHRWASIVIMVITTGLVFLVGSQLKSELAPLEDKSRLQIIATAPEGTSYEMMDNYITQIDRIVDTLKVRASLLSVTAPSFGASASANSGFIRVTLVEPDKRDITQQELADQMSALLKGYTFARTFVVQEQTIGGGRGAGLPVQYVIQAPTFEKLKEIVPKFFERAQADPAFQIVDLNLKFNKPELRVEIDRERARVLGVSVIDIAQTLQLFFSGQRFGYFVLEGKQYQVIGEASRDNRNEPLDLRSVTIRNDRGELITLDNVVRLTDESSPPQLYRYNRYVSATFSASPAKDVTLGQGIDAMNKIAAEVLDDSFSTDLAGTSKEFQESSGSLLFAFALALLLVYLTLAAQFESFTDPLTIMFTVPLAIAGAVLSLWLTGQTLNIFSQIGIIVLIGLVTKNGILIVEFANQRKEEGLSKAEAVIDSATQRLRPILMTSLASGLGALPIALALGAASKSRSPIGIVIIGGLLFSLILTLYVIPALYTYLSGEHKPVPRPEPKQAPQLAEA